MENLYIIQNDVSAIEQSLHNLVQVYSEDDAILLLAENVLALTTHLNELSGFNTLYILSDDALMLDSSYLAQIPNVTMIDHKQWAELVLQAKSVIKL